MTSNAYEAAIDRMEAARRRCLKARRLAERIVREADAEFDAAEDNLVRYETSPGLSLPEYRPGYHEHWRPGQPHVKHVHAAGRTPHEHAAEATS
jgi:hypothetical protein